MELDEFSNMKVKELQAALKKRNLDHRGNKAVLAERLRKHAQNDTLDGKETQIVQNNNLNDSTSQDLENSEEAQVEEGKENISSTDNDQHEGNELETSERNDSFDGVGAAGIQASSTVSIDVFDASQKARSEDNTSPNSSDVSKLKTFDDQNSVTSEAAAESLERNEVDPGKSTEKSSQENTRRLPLQNPTEEDGSNHQTTSDEVATCTLRVDNFRRPFTLKSAKSLVQEFGNYVEDGFWMDNIKTHCYVTYASCDVAKRIRDYLDAKIWPPENGIALKASFSSQMAAEIASGSTKSEITPRANTLDRAQTIRKDSYSSRREPLALDTLFMKTEAKPVLYYLPAKSQQRGRQEDASCNAHKERHARKRPFSESYSRSHAPKMRRSRLPRW